MIDEQILIQHFDRIASQRPAWFRKNHLYHDQIARACRPFLNPDSRVLELGCSTGDLLNLLKPAHGVGVDISPKSIAIAREQYPRLHWICANIDALPDTPPLDQPFDLIVMSDLVGYLHDVQWTLENVRRLTHSHSRLVISLWNWMWEPVLRIAERLRLKAPDLLVRSNWLSPVALNSLLKLAGYEPLQTVSGLLFPYQVPIIEPIINTFSHAPILDHVTLVRMVVARPAEQPQKQRPVSVTVVIPTRNEVGNVEAAVRRTPEMGRHTELLFIDGNSTDGTVETIHQVIAANPQRDIRFMSQIPPTSPDANTPPDLMLKLGKGDAIRKAFAAASGDILMILDSDLSVPPEDLPRFYDALVTGKGRFINGTRLVYPQEQAAMPLTNRIGNVGFSLLFSWLLGQQISDTLCGTKALYREDYEAIAANRNYFGDFDPFGDFDLLFGAAWLGLPIIELPVHYHARTHGNSKVRVGMHGPLLGRMSLVALLRFKIQPLVSGVRSGRAVTGSLPINHRRLALTLLAVTAGLIAWLLLRLFHYRRTSR